jgi:putative ABC transport system substrate-binding protein
LARAQQAALPVVGFLSPQSADEDYKNWTVPFLQGLKEAGYVEGQNVVVEYRNMIVCPRSQPISSAAA